MHAYNSAFFGLFENVFKLMEMGLGKSCGNDFKKGELEVFAKLVGERDQTVGLCVKFISKYFFRNHILVENFTNSMILVLLNPFCPNRKHQTGRSLIFVQREI